MKQPTKTALEDTIMSLEEAARCFEQGGYPPNLAKANPVVAAKQRAMAAARRAQLAELYGPNTRVTVTPAGRAVLEP